MKHPQTRTQVRRSCLSAAIALTLVPLLGIAQEQSPAGTDAGTTELDRILVTGSRIRQVDVETAAPVQDEGLRAALEVLARNVLSRAKT